MNERDSEAVTGLLMDTGYTSASSIEEADVILYNTCSVRDHAEQKVFGRLGAFKKLKEKNPGLVIGILGCMAQEHGSDFFKMNPEIDIVCGTGNLSQIAELVEDVKSRRGPRLAIDRLDDDYALDGITFRANPLRTQVTIMKGCDHHCTYCIVPYTRGKEISRSSESILKEMKDLEGRGFQDVLLLGQNVNSYGKGLPEDIDFAGLLEKIQDTAPKIPRIRFITSHPKDAHERLFTAMRDLPSVCEHLHLPVQSGSDRILKRMKREHAAQWYLDQVTEYRALVPNGSLSTDFIVGFPGETEEDFEATLAMVEKVRFDSAYVFAYSERPGTPATKLPDDVPNEEKNRRLQRLLAFQRSISLEKNLSLVGKREEVLFESKTRREEPASPAGRGRYVGRTRAFKRVVVSSDKDLTGQTHPVRVTAAADETLLGELCA